MTKSTPSHQGSPGTVSVINSNSSKSVTAAIDVAVVPLRFFGCPRIDVVDLSQGPPGIMT